MCVDMNKVGFRTVATASGSCSAPVSYETPVGAASTVQGQYPKICRVSVNVFFVRVFPGLVIQSSAFSQKAYSPSRLL